MTNYISAAETFNHDFNPMPVDAAVIQAIESQMHMEALPEIAIPVDELGAADDIRWDKVWALRGAIGAGTYAVAATDLAGKLMLALQA
jgi:anti-sigma28 factor (negative regulator of flagellin synthesis)